MKQEVQIINEGGSIIISHYIIHGGYCKDINHCCRKWLNNCHKSQLNTIQPSSSDQYRPLLKWQGCFFTSSSCGFGFSLLKYVCENFKLCCWSMISVSLSAAVISEQEYTSAKNTKGYQAFSSPTDRLIFKWLIFKKGSFMAHFVAHSTRLQMGPLWR